MTKWDESNGTQRYSERCCSAIEFISKFVQKLLFSLVIFKLSKKYSDWILN